MTKSDKTGNPALEVVGPGALIVSAVRFEAPVGKAYGFKNGKVTKLENYRSKKAKGETHLLSKFEDFVSWRKSMTSEYMLVSGTFETDGEVQVVFKGNEGPGEVSASKDYLAHREQPGILIGDIDFKDPAEVAGLYLGGDQPYNTQDAALAALSKVLPEANGCALLVCWSTSSNLFMEKKRVKGTGGIRFYIPVANASRIPILLDIMHKRSWLLGEGWAFVDGAGKFQERSLVDTALARPTQPDYAAPDLRDGLTQERDWCEFEGCYLDPNLVVMTPAQEVEYQAASAKAESKLAPEMATQRKIWLSREAKKHKKNGRNTKQSMSAAIQLLDNGVLLPTGSVLFDDGPEVSIFDLLTDGSMNDHKTCKDPLEPNYRGGASVAIFFWNDGVGPVIYSYAHGPKKYTLKHDAESAQKLLASGDDNIVSLALAQTAFRSNSEELKLEKEAAKALGLGNNVTAFRKDVAEAKKRLHGDGGENELDAASLAAIADGRWPINKQLPSSIFPARKGATILSHAENYKAMMAAYGYGCSYDVIKKEVVWTGPQISMATDNAYLALFSKMKGLSALNSLPYGNADLNAHLPAIAEENQINPVRDCLAALEWDGEDRFGQLVQAIEPHDTEVAEIALRVWFTGAVAACEHFETGLKLLQIARPSFEYVLALSGDQGVNKTKGFLSLVPKALAKYAKDGLSIRTSNKDSVKIAVSYWLVELGELDATFRQGQIAELKAFLSTEADELRLPYAQGYSKFKRRTAFIGTVNQDKFLKDTTGNRRYLVLDIAKGFPAWSAYEVDQLWAQAWSRYVGGAQWWPTDSEQKLLDANAELFRQHSWFEDELETRYAWGEEPDNRIRTRTTELIRLLSGNHRPNNDAKEIADLGNALRRLWLANGAYKDGSKLMVRVDGSLTKVNSDGGKHKGWLLPPNRLRRVGQPKTIQSGDPKVTGAFWERGHTKKR
jgi:hypothetical protein